MQKYVFVNNISITVCRCSRDTRPNLQYSIGKILKVVVQLGGDTVDALLHHGVHEAVELVLGEVEVKPVLHRLDGAGRVVEAG